MTSSSGKVVANEVKKEGGAMSLYTAEVKPAFCETLCCDKVFRSALARERKRCERSGLAMVLLLINVQDGQERHSLDMLSQVLEALAAIKSEIDTIGWYMQGTIVGLIVPEINPAQLLQRCEWLEAELRKALSSLSGDNLAKQFSVAWHTFPKPHGLVEEDLNNCDLYVYPELQHDRATLDHFRFSKRVIDILGSLLLLAILAPLLLAIAGLVKISSRGPVIFRQMRIGQRLKPFMIFKFRTMYVHSDQAIHRDYVNWFIRDSDKNEDAEKKKLFKLTNDPRITSIGNFLRKTSMDELPQLWNVLVGDMSLVGPRPALWYEVQQYKPWHWRRILEAKPGITGLWQVTGRSRTTFEDMVRLDLRYSRGRSLWTDIKILLMTPSAVIKGKGAC